MKILVLGANGQLGTDLLAEGGRRNKVEMRGLTRSELDMENLEAIPQILRDYPADVIVNCTSYHKTDEVEDNGTKAVTINAHAVEALAKAADEQGARFVHVSTDYVFDGTNSTPYRESDTPAPINVYGATKYLGETLARRASKDALILRVASLFGVAGASGKGGNFVEAMLRLAKEHGQLRVVNDVRMSPTSTRTIAYFLLELLEKQADAGIYHVVNSGDATWYEFATEIIKLVGWDIPVHPVTSDEFPTRAARPEYSVLSNQKLSEAVSGCPEHWNDALKEYLAKKGYL